MKSLTKTAFNDILKNGFDSVAQECFLRINKPDLAAEVFGLHGHAPDWERLKRDNLGRFDYIATLAKNLSKVADKLDNKGKFVQADKVDGILKFVQGR